MKGAYHNPAVIYCLFFLSVVFYEKKENGFRHISHNYRFPRKNFFVIACNGKDLFRIISLQKKDLNGHRRGFLRTGLLHFCAVEDHTGGKKALIQARILK